MINSILNDKENEYKNIRYNSCICHTLQLVVSSISKKSTIITRFDSLLYSFHELSMNRHVHCTVGSFFPKNLSIRWLSRIQIVNWIIKHKDILQNCILTNMDHSTKILFASLVNENVFNTIILIGELIFPIYQLVLYFEKNDSTVPLIVPALRYLKQYYKNCLVSPKFLELKSLVSDLLQEIEFRKTHTLDWNLLKCSYYLTFLGRYRLLKKMKKDSKKSILETEYRTLPSFQFKPETIMKHIANNLDDGVNDSIESNNFFYFEKEQVEITSEEEFLDSHNKNILFSINSLLQSMTNIIHHNETVRTIDEFYFNKNLDELISDLYGDRGLIGDIAIWNWISINNPKNTDVICVIIGLITTPASEAMVERFFSVQKRALTHFRSNSDNDLILARLRMMTNN